MNMEKNTTKEGLLRVVGVPELALTIVNFTIGAGIFVLPAVVGIKMGAYSIFCYLFCAIILATIMLCYAEVGSKVTSSGGTYAYITAAFGEFPGFLINWMLTFGFNVMADAALMNIIADSISVVLPVFLNPWVRALFFLLILSFFMTINIRGAKHGVSFIKWMAIIKLIPLFAVILFGVFFVKVENLAFENMPTISEFGSSALVLFFAFVGFESALNLSGEIKDSKRTVPRGILFAGLLILFIYLLLQTVTQGVLGSQMSVYSDAPLAAVAEKIVGPIGGIILLVTAALSCFSSVGADVMTCPRLLFAGAKDALFPKILAKVHPKFATPYTAIICYGALIFIFSIAGGFEQLAILASATILLVYLSVILATLKLRRNKVATEEKTFKVPGGLVIPVIGIVSICCLLTSLSKNEILIELIFIAVISGIYFFMKRIQKQRIK